jgi:hypothetical protein
MNDIFTELIEITPELATNYLEECSYEFNRKVRERHVDFLADAMRKDRFDPTAQIAFARVTNDRDYLINGQHTLNAIIKHGSSQVLNVIHYAVESYNEVHSLFSHYDIGNLRTFADSIRAYGVAKETGLTHTQITRLSAALRYMKSDFPRGAAQGKISTEDMIELIRDWNDEALLVFNLLADGEKGVKRRLEISSVLSVLLVIIRYSPIKGTEFISKVATDDELKVGDPRKALNRYLRDTSKNTVATGKKHAPNGQLSRACAKAWDRFLSKAFVKNINIGKIEIGKPIIIKGSPYNGVVKD